MCADGTHTHTYRQRRKTNSRWWVSASSFLAVDFYQNPITCCFATTSYSFLFRFFSVCSCFPVPVNCHSITFWNVRVLALGPSFLHLRFRYCWPVSLNRSGDERSERERKRKRREKITENSKIMSTTFPKCHKPEEKTQERVRENEQWEN